MTAQVMKVRRERIAACMTCPICNKVFKEATTISLCLHTFCRKCIYEKLSDEEEVDCCPVCNIDLGCIPVEKLRPDHNMQDIVSKIFPPKRNITKPPEIPVPSSSLNAKRKERSLSSLVVGTPQVSVATNLVGRRAKAPKLSAAKGRSPCSIEELNRKEEEPIDNGGQSSSSEALNKFPNQRHAKETSTTPVPSNHRSHGRARETETEPWGRKAEMWTPLNCLLEAATGTGTKPSNFDYQDFSNPKPLPSDFSNKEYLKSAKPEKVDERESYLFGTKGKENGHRVMMEEDEHARILLPGEARSRRIQAMKRKQSAAAGKLVAPQGFLTTMRDKQVRRNRQVWFSLVASKDQDSCTPLPQISANYLRLKDGNIPVASIQKYLAKKLDLPNESEVQVMCHGQRMHPTAPLHDLVDLWVRETPGTKMVPATTVGASGLDFVMILSYARRAQAG